MFDLPGTYAGLRIVASEHWPQEFVRFETRNIPAHRDIRWLSRMLRKIGIRLDPWVEIEVPIYRDADPAVDQVRGIIYCGIRTYQQFRAVLPAASF